MASLSFASKEIFRVHESGLPLDFTSFSPLPPVLIMLAGYPDTAASWSRLAPHFQSSHHVLSLAMPGYEDSSLPPGRRWGSPCWARLGSAIVLLYAAQYPPKNIDKLVALDVGGLDVTDLSLKQVAVMLCYQSFFALVFLISRLLPREAWAFPLLVAFPFKLLGPCPHETEVPFSISVKDIKIHMLYPYLQLYWPFLGGEYRPLPLSFTWTDHVPQLYLYGGEKRVMFHTRRYLDRLSQSPISDSKMLPAAGHWLHWTHPETVAHEMKLFFRR